jgi:hypothetical protein
MGMTVTWMNALTIWNGWNNTLLVRNWFIKRDQFFLLLNQDRQENCMHRVKSRNNGTEDACALALFIRASRIALSSPRNALRKSDSSPIIPSRSILKLGTVLPIYSTEFIQFNLTVKKGYLQEGTTNNWRHSIYFVLQFSDYVNIR